MVPDYLAIGHITKDLLEGGVTVGGTAFYAALTAAKLGFKAAIVTSSAYSDSLLDFVLGAHGVTVHHLPSEQTLTFKNEYDETGHRVQHILARANPLTILDVPQRWRSAPIVHLGPLVGEQGAGLLSAFPDSLLLVTPQGWMRNWDREGLVRTIPLPETPQFEDLRQYADIVVMSDEDIGYSMDSAEWLAHQLKLFVLTRGAKGSRTFFEDKRWASVARKVAEVVDPTGAGDVFAAAFAIKYLEDLDPGRAAAFANVVASISIEGIGASAIPTRGKVAAWRP